MLRERQNKEVVRMEAVRIERRKDGANVKITGITEYYRAGETVAVEIEGVTAEVEVTNSYGDPDEGTGYAYGKAPEAPESIPAGRELSHDEVARMLTRPPWTWRKSGRYERLPEKDMPLRGEFRPAPPTGEILPPRLPEGCGAKTEHRPLFPLPQAG